MTPKTILNISGGIDVLTPETELGDDVARIVENVVIHNDGGFDLRAGATRVAELANPRQLWMSKDLSKILAVADGMLYTVSGAVTEPIVEPLSSIARTDDVPIAEVGGMIYIADDVVYRLDASGPDLSYGTAGTADLSGIEPDLTEVGGSLPAGRYGFAFSAVGPTGRESGLSNVAWIDLAADAGVQLALPEWVGEAVKYRIYRTTTDGGDDLRLCDTIPIATSYTITGGEVGRLARNRYLAPLPAGTQLFEYRGRMYSAVDSFLFCSEPLNAELYDTRSGFVALPGGIRMAAPVENGIFIGTDTQILFLNGTGPGDFRLERAAGNGAFEQIAEIASAQYFNPKLVDTAREVALWLSPIGYQIGLPGGAVASPQEGKVRLADVGRVETLAFTLDGVKQIVSAVEAMTLGNGGATDTTP